jgi:LacI family transcriptional regulator
LGKKRPGPSSGKSLARKQVAIVFPNYAVNTTIRGVAIGIAEEAEPEPAWDFQLFEYSNETAKLLLRGSFDGVLAIGLLEEDLPLMERLESAGIPAVHAGELHVGHPFYEVRAPNELTGRIGARHLLECGFTRFAFIGEGHMNEQKRCEGFVAALAEAGHIDVRCCSFGNRAKASPAVRKFLTGLRRPVGVMASYDRCGWMVAREAFAADIAIPNELALLGVGNDDPWCALATPPLSSVAMPGEAIGRQALRVLDELIAGRRPPRHVDITTAHVVDRESTSIFHAEHSEIAAAIGYIRENYAARITVRDVADHVGVSRSTLDVGVKQALGRTPQQEIQRLRFTAAQNLLANSETPMKIIARRCGFSDNKHFSAAFRTATGLTPRDYRDQNRRGRSDQ